MGVSMKKKELTSRQQDVLDLLRKGLTNSEICRALCISENTVKVHLANIYKILNVSNRIEAISSGTSTMDSPNGDQEISLAISHGENVKSFPLAHTLFLAIVEALQGCNVFKIKICTENECDTDSDYQIKLSSPQGEDETLFIALYRKDSTTLLWSNLQKIPNGNEIKLLTEQNSIQLFRQIIQAAAETYKNTPDIKPQWWFASCHTITKMENRNKDEFERSEKLQQSLLELRLHKDFVVGALASVYYGAMTENWIKSEECAQKLEQIACQTMRENPTSIYSPYSMALYNMFLGNHKEAISYFESIMNSPSPLHIVCRRLLSQLYSLIDRLDDALVQLDEYDRYIPRSMYQPFQYVAKAFIHFMRNEYDSCKKVTEQILMFHPEIPYARLLLIACTFKEGKLEEHDKQVKLLFEYNSNYSQDDLNRFLNCFAPKQRNLIAGCLENIFE